MAPVGRLGPKIGGRVALFCSGCNSHSHVGCGGSSSSSSSSSRPVCVQVNVDKTVQKLFISVNAIFYT